MTRSKGSRLADAKDIAIMVARTVIKVQADAAYSLRRACQSSKQETQKQPGSMNRDAMYLSDA